MKFCKQIALALLFSIYTPGLAKAQLTCNLQHVSNCRNINVLMSPSLGKKIHLFLRDITYSTNNRIFPAAEIASMYLGGAPNPRIDIENLSIFTACQPHNCTSRAGIIFNKSNEIVSIFLYEPEKIDPENFHPLTYKATIYKVNGGCINKETIRRIIMSDLNNDNLHIIGIDIKIKEL